MNTTATTDSDHYQRHVIRHDWRLLVVLPQPPTTFTAKDVNVDLRPAEWDKLQRVGIVEVVDRTKPGPRESLRSHYRLRENVYRTLRDGGYYDRDPCGEDGLLPCGSDRFDNVGGDRPLQCKNCGERYAKPEDA